MDGIPDRRRARRVRFRHTQYAQPASSQSRANIMASQSSLSERKNRSPTLSALRTQAAKLSVARANLEFAHHQQQNMGGAWVFTRATAENEYVKCITRYSCLANRMSSVRARDLRATFTRRKFGGLGMNCAEELLEMYP